jgi:intein/homing endonuclease
MYYAGLLMADGNIARHRKLMQIEILKKDRELVDGLKEFAEYTGRVETRTRTHESGKKSRMVILRITSPGIVGDLSLFGVISRKSEKGKIPKWIIGHSLSEFYFRGIFDGDGCIGVRKGKHCFGKKFITFGGTPTVVRAFRKWAYMKTGEKGGLSKRTKKFWMLFYSYHSVPKVGQALYGDKRGMRLERKAMLI